MSWPPRRASRFGRPSRREVHESADDSSHEQEDDQCDEVLALVDGPLVDRRNEVPVGQQERGHARGQRRPHTTDGGDHDDRQQVQQQRGLQLEGLPSRGHDQSEEGQHDRAQDRAGDLAPGREDPTAAGAAERGFRLRFLARDHVHVDRPRGADHAVDHRPPRELDPTRPAAGPKDQLGGILRARELHQCLADVVTNNLVIRAPQLGEQRPMLGQELLGWSGEAVC
jgi:hypothetical protein